MAFLFELLFILITVHNQAHKCELHANIYLSRMFSYIKEVVLNCTLRTFSRDVEKYYFGGR